MIRIVNGTLLFAKSGFIDNTADQDEIAGLDNATQLLEESMFVLPRREHIGESSLFFSDLQFMQADKVMPHMVEFKLLKGRNDLLAIVPLMENTEGEYKHWVMWI